MICANFWAGRFTYTTFLIWSSYILEVSPYEVTDSERSYNLLKITQLRQGGIRTRYGCLQNLVSSLHTMLEDCLTAPLKSS